MGCGVLAGIALSLAGAGTQAYASNQENNAMNNAVSAELARQAGFTNQAQGVFDTSLGQSTPQAAQQQIAQGTQQSLGTTAQAQLPSASFSLPQPVGGTNAGASADSSAQAARNVASNQANAGLQGYSNYTLQQYLKDLQAKNQLGIINQNAQGWANILPTQLAAAKSSEQGLTDLGTLLGAIGGPLTAYNLAGSATNGLGQLLQQGFTAGGLNALTNIYNQTGQMPLSYDLPATL